MFKTRAFYIAQDGLKLVILLKFQASLTVLVSKAFFIEAIAVVFLP